jgi:hypothetical protein
MRIKPLVGITAAAALAAFAGSANAGSLTLVPQSASINVGQSITFDLVMDFTGENTFGGGTDFFYDASVLDFTSWVFDPGFNLDDASSRQTPDDCNTSSDIGCGNNGSVSFPGLSELNDMGVVNFADGMTGTATIGQLTFEALSAGMTSVFMGANADCTNCVGNTGPWTSADTFMEDNPTFYEGSVTVVPVPAAVWMMFSALGALVGFRRLA